MTNAQGNRGWGALMVAAVLMMLTAAIAAPAQIYNIGASDEASRAVIFPKCFGLHSAKEEK